MPRTRLIEPYPEDAGGLDFGDFFDDVELVHAAMTKLEVNLGDAVCYCLQFHAVEGGISWFEPYGVEFALNGLADGALKLPERIQYDRLLHWDGSGLQWPVLSEWQNDAEPARHPARIADAEWHGQVLLRSGTRYVGYFKAAVPKGCPRPDDEMVRDAYRQVYLWLREELEKRRRRQSLNDPALLKTVRGTALAIRRDLKESGPEGVAKALRRIGTLITSHLGARFNRVACLLPRSSGKLTCLYAHGGDCSDEFSRRVQFPLGDRQHTILQVQQSIDVDAPPLDDPLYRDLVAMPVTLNLDSQSALAELWRKNGDLGLMPSALRVESPESYVVDRESGAVRFPAPQILCLKVGAWDPWFESLRNEGKARSLFQNQNGNWYVFPWRHQSRLIGLVVVDLGFWSDFRETKDIVPRSLMTQTLLEHLSTDFVDVTW